MARILLIEDSPTDTAVLTQLLERNGHQVLASADAEDGIAVCKREMPDLVLMDVILPGMNGFQATRALSRDAATSAIPVLIVSRSEERRVGKECRTGGSQNGNEEVVCTGSCIL